MCYVWNQATKEYLLLFWGSYLSFMVVLALVVPSLREPSSRVRMVRIGVLLPPWIAFVLGVVIVPVSDLELGQFAVQVGLNIRFVGDEYFENCRMAWRLAFLPIHFVGSVISALLAWKMNWDGELN